MLQKKTRIIKNYSLYLSYNKVRETNNTKIMKTIKVLYDQYEWKKGKGTILIEFVLNTETGKTYWREAKPSEDYHGDNISLMAAPW